MYNVLGEDSEIQEIKTILDMFYEKSQTCKKLLEEPVTISFVASGQSESGGQAKGTQVIIDLLSSATGGRMNAKEAAESALFEVQNMRNSPTYNNLKKDLLAGQMTLKAYGERMVETEHKSTHMVAEILGEVQRTSTFTSIKSVQASVKPPRPDLSKGYRPSIWGAKQCANDRKGWQYAAKTPHSKKPNASLVMKLPSAEKYSFEVVRDLKFIEHLLKKMVKLTFQMRHQPAKVVEAGQIVAGVNNKPSVCIYCAFLGVLSALDSTKNPNWKVLWLGNKNQWQFSKDMKDAANVNQNLEAYAENILKNPLRELGDQQKSIRFR